MKAIDPREFRRALGCFVTGVTVVMTKDTEGLPRGFTANSFSSVSLQPPLVSVCIDRSIASYQVFSECRGFSVNILVESQKDISNLFASSNKDKFTGIAWQTSQLTHAPHLVESVAWFDCVPYKRIDAGDHMILIGEVRDFSYSEQSPLSFCRGNYVSFSLIQDILSQQSRQGLRIGCIVDGGDSVLLVREGDYWVAPSSQSLGERGQKGGLHGVLQDLGIDVELSFIFSVFDGPAEGQLSIFYRSEPIEMGELSTADARAFDFDEIPWDELQYEGHRSMLRRYIDERRRFRFGIYVGTSEAGAVVDYSHGPEGEILE